MVNAIAGNDVLDDSSFIYYVAPFTASLIAAALYKFVFSPDSEEEQDALVSKETTDAHTDEN